MSKVTMMAIDTMGPVLLIIILIGLIATVRADPNAVRRIEDEEDELRHEARESRSQRRGRESSRSGRRRRISI